MLRALRKKNGMFFGSFLQFLKRKSMPLPSVEIPPPAVAPVIPEITVPPIDIFNSIALPLILIFEGSIFTNHPYDKGGPTRFGVIQRVYDQYRTDKGLPVQSVINIKDTEISDIYKNQYWIPSKCDQMGDKLSVVVFDTSVNSGPGRSIKILQQAIGAKVDGVIGTETLDKLKSSDTLKLANDFIGKREEFYKNIVQKDFTQQVFLKGWLRRVNFLRDYINGVKDLIQIKKEW